MGAHRKNRSTSYNTIEMCEFKSTDARVTQLTYIVHGTRGDRVPVMFFVGQTLIFSSTAFSCSQSPDGYAFLPHILAQITNVYFY